MKTILVATDGSEHATRAVRFAAKLANEFRAALHIVTVGQEWSVEMRKFADSEGVSPGDVLESTNQSILAEARDAAEFEGTTHSHSAAGDPAEAIIAIAEKVKADLIVAGRRGRGQLRGLLFGSVSQKLVTLSPCAVVVVP